MKMKTKSVLFTPIQVGKIEIPCREGSEIRVHLLQQMLQPERNLLRCPQRMNEIK